MLRHHFTHMEENVKRFQFSLSPLFLVTLLIPALLLRTPGIAMAAGCGSFRIVATPKAIFN